MDWILLILIFFALPSLTSFFKEVWRRIRPKSSARERYNPQGGKWAIVTGASRGIGECLCRELALQGFNLLMIARSTAQMEKLAGELQRRHAGGQFRPLAVDCAAAWPQIEGVLRAAIDPLDVSVLVNNAGMAPSKIGEFERESPEFMGRLLALNVEFPTFLTHLVIPKLKQNPSGCIVNIGSSSAANCMPYFSLYSASKGFLAVFSSALAAELAPFHIDVQVFEFGPVATDMISNPKQNILIQNPAVTAQLILNNLGHGEKITPFLAHQLYVAARSNCLLDLRLFFAKKMKQIQESLQSNQTHVHSD